MGITEITQIISSVGFPIFAYLLMVKQNSDNQKAHKEEMEKLSETLQKNTEAINELRISLGGLER